MPSVFCTVHFVFNLHFEIKKVTISVWHSLAFQELLCHTYTFQMGCIGIPILYILNGSHQLYLSTPNSVGKFWV